MEAYRGAKKLTFSQMPRSQTAHQKLIPYLVLQQLLIESDSEHPQSAFDIIVFHEGERGVNTDRHSIYKDIEEMRSSTSIR